jgi:hypothetical protein
MRVIFPSQRWSGVGLALLGAALLAGCASPEGRGYWRALDMAGLHLAPVALAAPLAQEDRRSCQRARAGLQEQLVRRLPRRLGAVAWVPPEGAAPGEGTGTLRVAITGCRLTSHQWDVGGGEPDITFYETLRLRVRLSAPDGERLLVRELETVEQVHTHLPTPAFAFSRSLPARQVAGLFSRGRVWMTKEGPGP